MILNLFKIFVHKYLIITLLGKEIEEILIVRDVNIFEKVSLRKPNEPHDV